MLRYVDEEKIQHKILNGIFRAGADMIIRHYARGVFWKGWLLGEYGRG